MSTNDVKTFVGIKGGEGGAHAEAFDDYFKVLLMFVDVSFEVNFLDITHVNGFIHG